MPASAPPVSMPSTPAFRMARYACPQADSQPSWVNPPPSPLETQRHTLANPGRSWTPAV